MIVATELVEQGSEEWKAARCGNITGSRFTDVMASSTLTLRFVERAGDNPEGLRPNQQFVFDMLEAQSEPITIKDLAAKCDCSDSPIKTMIKNKVLRERQVTERAIGDSAESYMLELIEETLTGRPHYTPTTKAMEHGTKWEPTAREVYENHTGNFVNESGFKLMDGHDIGLSSDGLIGDRGSIEIKCPFNPVVHLRTWKRGVVPSEYRWQCVGGLLVHDRDWCDFISYCPSFEMPHAMKVIRIERNEDEINELRDGLFFFESKFNELKKELGV